MAAEIGKNQAVAGVERGGDRIPEFVVAGKGME
jgi:hypothetical protein